MHQHTHKHSHTCSLTTVINITPQHNPSPQHNPLRLQGSIQLSTAAAVFWQRGRWQRSVPANNVPILWHFSASPEICRLLKIQFIQKGDPHVTLFPVHFPCTHGSRVGWGWGWVYPSCPWVKFRWTSRQFTVPCSPLVGGTLYKPATFLPWRKKMSL